MVDMSADVHGVFIFLYLYMFMQVLVYFLIKGE